MKVFPHSPHSHADTINEMETQNESEVKGEGKGERGREER